MKHRRAFKRLLSDEARVINSRMDGHWTLDDQRERTTQKLTDVLWSTHNSQHARLAEQLTKNEQNANEWRTALNDRDASIQTLRSEMRETMMPRLEYQSEHRSLQKQFEAKDAGTEARVAALEKSQVTASAQREGGRSVLSDGRTVVLFIISIIGVVISLFLLLRDFLATSGPT